MNMQEFLTTHISGNLYWKDRQGLYLGCNPAFALIAGLAHPDDIIGRSDQELWGDSLSANEIENLCLIDQTVMQQGVEKTVEEVGLDSQHNLAHYLSKKVPLRNEAGEVVGLVGLSIDITREKKFRVEQSVIRNVKGNLYWKDLEGRYLGCNQAFCELVGLSAPDHIQGQSDADFFSHLMSEEDLAQLRENDWRVMQTDTEHTFEETCIDSKGNQAHYLTKKVPLRDETNTVIGLIGISIDITVEKALKAELLLEKERALAASKAKSEFIANMSHDIRTPLTGILGMADRLLDAANTLQETASTDHLPQAKLTDFMAQVQHDVTCLSQAAGQLLKLSHRVLDTAKLDAGLTDPDARVFSLSTLITDHITLLQPAVQHKQLTLSSSFDPHIPEAISAPYALLETVVVNLVSNAVKFTHQGSISVALRPAAPFTERPAAGSLVTLKLEIRDTGIGIPPEQREAIFDHFTRLHPAYENQYPGSGLGLYAVKQAVDALPDGEIKLESTLGAGSCFTVIFSVHVAEAPDSAHHKPVAPQPSPYADLIPVAPPPSLQPRQSLPADHQQTDQPILLLVEDNDIAALAVSHLIEKAGYQMARAKTGEQAVHLATSRPYHLILLDIGLPDFSGLVVAEKLRATPGLSADQLPIVALTGHGNDAETNKLAAQLGINQVLTKPADPKRLQGLLTQYAQTT